MKVEARTEYRYSRVRKDILRAFKPTDIVVYAAIEGHAWKGKNTATPSVATIRKHTRLSQPTVERAIRRLSTSLWYYCRHCGYAYIATPEFTHDTLAESIKKLKDTRSEYERVLDLKKRLEAHTKVLCPEPHKEGLKPTMEITGPAIRRTSRSGSSNEYFIFR